MRLKNTPNANKLRLGKRCIPKPPPPPKPTLKQKIKRFFSKATLIALDAKLDVCFNKLESFFD